MTSHTCPICGKPVEKTATSFPFCSRRCRTTDLGRWLDERYRVAVRTGSVPDADDGDSDTAPGM